MFPGVRRVYWFVLAVALLLALALPVATLWHASAAALHVQACVFPAAPRVGQPTWLIVAPTTAADRTALDGPWATVVTHWDMVSMSMGTLHRTLVGSAAAEGVLAVPLQFSMAGIWWARVTLSTPGRPRWQQSVRFAVAPYTTGQPPARSNASPSLITAPQGDQSPCVKTAT